MPLLYGNAQETSQTSFSVSPQWFKRPIFDRSEAYSALSLPRPRILADDELYISSMENAAPLEPNHTVHCKVSLNHTLLSSLSVRVGAGTQVIFASSVNARFLVGRPESNSLPRKQQLSASRGICLYFQR